MTRPVITLLTDFGLADGYVAAMKGVILGLAPQAALVDVSHHIAPQAVAQAAFVLDSVFDYYPAGTVHVAVVDPGVGTPRRALAVRIQHQTVLAPDNGLVSPLLRRYGAEAVHAIESETLFRSPASRTFHGRDVFAPVAARLATGTALADVGPQIEDPVLLPEPAFRTDDSVLTGEIIHIDRFGNAVTNVPASALPGAAFSVTVATHPSIPFRTTYSEVPHGEGLALLGSHGRLEIAVNGGSAASQLSLQIGQVVTIHWGKA